MSSFLATFFEQCSICLCQFEQWLANFRHSVYFKQSTMHWKLDLFPNVLFLEHRNLKIDTVLFEWAFYQFRAFISDLKCMYHNFFSFQGKFYIFIRGKKKKSWDSILMSVLLKAFVTSRSGKVIGFGALYVCPFNCLLYYCSVHF